MGRPMGTRSTVHRVKDIYVQTAYTGRTAPVIYAFMTRWDAETYSRPYKIVRPGDRDDTKPRHGGRKEYIQLDSFKSGYGKGFYTVEEIPERDGLIWDDSLEQWVSAI